MFIQILSRLMSILKSTKQIFRQCASVPSPHFALFNFIIELRKLFTECLVLNWKVTHVAKYWSWLASAHFKLELDNKAILCYLMDGTRQDKGGCDWQYQGELDPNRWNCVQSFMLGKEKWEPSDPFWGPHDYKGIVNHLWGVTKPWYTSLQSTFKICNK